MLMSASHSLGICSIDLINYPRGAQAHPTQSLVTTYLHITWTFEYKNGMWSRMPNALFLRSNCSAISSFFFHCVSLDSFCWSISHMCIVGNFFYSFSLSRVNLIFIFTICSPCQMWLHGSQLLLRNWINWRQSHLFHLQHHVPTSATVRGFCVFFSWH